MECKEKEGSVVRETTVQIEAEANAAQSDSSSDANGIGNAAEEQTLFIVETACTYDRSGGGGGGGTTDEMNVACKLPGERVKNVGFLQVNNHAECLSAGKTLDLTLKTIVATQGLEMSASCSGQLTATEAALMAATVSTATPKLDTKHQVDIETQYNGLEIDTAPTPSDSMPSIGSLVCRICHNADNPEQLVSPCLCKGSLTYVHIHCLERWISTSRCTTCELCQFTYNTEQTLRYTCMQSLRLWYSRAMSRRALQEDCQMFSLLTLVAFGIVGTLLVGIQYYALHTQTWGLSKLWTKSWMLFFLFITITVYFANVYMLIKSQLTPWYRWWQSARDIKLILENRRPFRNPSKARQSASIVSMYTHHDAQEIEQQQQQQQEQQQQQQAETAPSQIPIHANLTPNTLADYMDLHNLALGNHLQLLKERTQQPLAIKGPTEVETAPKNITPPSQSVASTKKYESVV